MKTCFEWLVSDGYVLTNHHVIDGAQDITVELTDRRTFKASVVGSDPPSALAVLRMKGTGFPTLPLDDSDRVRVGDVVLAVGNPLGIGQTVTMGIISAKGVRRAWAMEATKTSERSDALPFVILLIGLPVALAVRGLLELLDWILGVTIR